MHQDLNLHSTIIHPHIALNQRTFTIDLARQYLSTVLLLAPFHLTTRPSTLEIIATIFLNIFVGNLEVGPWGCHGCWDGKHNTDTNEPIWRGLVTLAKGAIVSEVPVS